MELTHIPPGDIGHMVKKARKLGAAVVIGHGETLVEPVAPGTNLAYIEAKVDILAHPGLVTEAEATLAKKNSVRFEITTRRGHCLSNGHVASMARAFGVKMILNTDSHGPSDLVSDETALKVLLGAGLDKKDILKIRKDTNELLNKI